MIETIIAYWQYATIAAIAFLSLIIYIVEGKITSGITFDYSDLPIIKPVRIPTKDKGFFGGLWLWLTGTRQWEFNKDWYFVIDDVEYVIPKGFVFDGASIPKAMWAIISPTGVLLIGATIHDYMYQNGKLLMRGKRKERIVTRREADRIFRQVSIEVNGFSIVNWMAWAGVRLFGWMFFKG